MFFLVNRIKKDHFLFYFNSCKLLFKLNFKLKGDHLYNLMTENDQRSGDELIALSHNNPDLKLNRIILKPDKTFDLVCNFDIDGNN